MSSAQARDWFEHLPANVRGAAFMLAAALLFSAMVALIKLLGQSFHVTQILLIRQSVMTVIVLPAILNGFPGSLRTHNLGLQFLRVTAALCAMLAGFTAIIHLPLAEATALAFAKSFFTTIFAIYFLGEIVGPRRWAAVFVGFAGVIVMLRPGTDAFSVYALYAVFGAAAAGLVMVLIRKMTRTDSPTTILTYQAIFVGLAVAAPGLYFWRAPSAEEWAWLLGIGVISYCAQMLNIMAYKNGEASVMAIFDYMRLIFAVALGYLVFSELPDVVTWIGAAIVVGAALYTVHREARQRRALTGSREGRGYHL